jgi:hypothetical protein
MKRWRFQIHLSTMVVLSLGAGVLLWANVAPRNRYMVGMNNSRPWAIECFQHAFQGWPLNMRKCVSPTVVLVVVPQAAQSELDTLVDGHWDYTLLTYEGFLRYAPKSARSYSFASEPAVVPTEWLWTSLVLDSILALTILFATLFLCEWRIRRRPKQPSLNPEPRPLNPTL